MKLISYVLAVFILFSCKKNSDLTHQNAQSNNNNGVVSDTIGHSLQLWGMTTQGGIHDSGTIFRMNADGSDYQDVYSFGDTSGAKPWGSLCKAPNGKLYGMTSVGGSTGTGTIFSYDPASNIFKKIVDFNIVAVPLGGQSSSSMMLANDNNIYGTSDLKLFKINPLNDELTILANFSDAIGGTGLWGGKLIQGVDGKLYGLGNHGGPDPIDAGTIFSFDISSNQITSLHSFNSLNHLGYEPWGSICQATDHNFYGFCAFDTSCLFKFDLSGNYSIVKKFNDQDGNNPWWNCGVIQTNGTKLYGLTMRGGSHSTGVLFSYDFNSSAYTVEHSFGSVVSNGIYDGLGPQGTVMLASNGYLYGMTSAGGSGFYGSTGVVGTIFRFLPATSEYRLVHAFKLSGGTVPAGNLIEY